MGQDRSDSSLEFLDSLSELVEVVVELSSLNVHDVVSDSGELVLCLGELLEDLLNCGSEGLTLGVTDVNFLEGRELDDSGGKVHDVLASLGEGVEADEESVGGDLPLVLGLSFVLKVGILELVADVNASLEDLGSL